MKKRIRERVTTAKGTGPPDDVVGKARRKSAAEKNAQRHDIDEAMGEGGGDEEEDWESEDDNEDGHGSGGAAKRPGTQRRKLRSFYFRTGAVVRTTTDNGRDVTAQSQVG